MYQTGDIIKGIVTGIEQYGIFVVFKDYYSGLIHISEVSKDFVKNINDYASIGEEIEVEVIEIDEYNKKLKLSIKNIKLKNEVQTDEGFKILEYNLPIWIERKINS